MDSFPNAPATPESELPAKFGLVTGKTVSFEKVAMHGASKVPVGSVLSGVLETDVRKNSGIRLDSGATISAVTALEEIGGTLFIRTATSTYRLRKESSPLAQEVFSIDDVATVETAKGSAYRYLPDGTTQRFKKVENRDYAPQAALVYVPSFEWLQANADPRLMPLIGENSSVYTDILLEYVHNQFRAGKSVYIVDAKGKHIETNAEIRAHNGPIYLALSTNDKVDLLLPVSHIPRIGFNTFDTRRYVDPKTNEQMRERHLGNAVVRIELKDGRQIR